MRSRGHQAHIDNRVSHSSCYECNADRERRFARDSKFSHTSVPREAMIEYLKYVKPRLEAIRNGENSTDAKHWHHKFIRALHSRIYSQIGNPPARKRNDSYLGRLAGMRFTGSKADATYLRKFAARGASAL